MTDNRQKLAQVHYLRIKAHWGKGWADKNAFADQRWPQNDKEWRQIGHGAPWDANVEMAKFHLELAREIVGQIGLSE